MMVSLAGPPSIPTLSLVPVETDFSRPLDLNEWNNVEDQGGEAIGTYKSKAAGGGAGEADFMRTQSFDPIDPPCIEPTQSGEFSRPCGGGGDPDHLCRDHFIPRTY